MTDQRRPVEPSEATGNDEVLVVQRIAAPPEAVFPFLVEPEKLLRWMGTRAEIEPVPGGKFWLDVNGTDVAVGSYTEIDPPRRVAFTWGWEASAEVPPGSTTVTMTLVADGDGTIVELRHTGLPHGAGDAHREGWAHFLPQLVDAVQQ